MKTLSVTYASSPSSDLLIPTLEFNNETAGVIRLAQSFNDLTATTELAETVTFIQSAWEVSLPNKDATGQQTLQFQICNVTGEAQRFIYDFLKSGKPTSVIYLGFQRYLFLKDFPDAVHYADLAGLKVRSEELNDGTTTIY